MAISSKQMAANASEGDRFWRRVLWAIFAVTVLRLVWLALGRADLYPDEAQYWLWSIHPAFGYYSKPPLLAWLIRLTTGLFGEDELAIRLSAPLLQFGASLVIFALARRLYDARIAAWSALAYATLPGVSAASVIMSTDAPLLFCWAVALYAFVVARASGGERWWIVTGLAIGFGLLAKYAMIYWLLSALLFLLMFRDERRHLPRFFAAAGLGLLIYSPNFFWNVANGFVTFRHTRDNAALGGPLFHPGQFFEFLGAQFGVFGPVFMAVLILVVVLSKRLMSDRRAQLLATFALPTLAITLTGSFLSRGHANWAAPAYVSATVLVVAWLIEHGWRRVVIASLAINIAAAVVVFTAHDAAAAIGLELPAKYDPLHRLRGWKTLGRVVGTMLYQQHPGAVLMADNREDMAALIYYVFPHPLNALKWNGNGGIHDEFDLTATPAKYIGADFLLVSHAPDNVERILSRFQSYDPPQHITIFLGGGATRSYEVYFLHNFMGYP